MRQIKVFMSIGFPKLHFLSGHWELGLRSKEANNPKKISESFFSEYFNYVSAGRSSVKGERSWRAGRNNSINKKGAERGHQS